MLQREDISTLVDEEAEKSVLSYYWFHPDRPINLFKKEDFYTKKWQNIFLFFKDLQKRNVISRDAVFNELKKLQDSGNLNGFGFTIDDFALVMTSNEDEISKDFEFNKNTLKEFAAKRRIVELSLRAREFAYADPMTEEKSEQQLLNEFERDLNNTVKGIDIYDEFSNDLNSITEEDVKDALVNEGGLLRTGYMFDAKEESDKELLIPDKALSFIVAPTSHGKSTMLMNLALRIIDKNPGKKVLYLTYEESLTDVIVSFLSVYCAYHQASPSRFNVNSTIKENLKGNNKYVAENQKNRYIHYKNKFFKLIKDGKLNVRYKDYDVEKLISYIQYMKANNACDIVMIDYAQLLMLHDSGRLSRQEQMKQICLKLKDLAINPSLGLPVILAAQFNRQVVSPLDLLYTNIREAGDIEQIANTIVAMWNCGFTNLETSNSNLLEKEYPGLSQKDETKIYAKILKRRKQRPNVKTLFNFDGRTGLITSSTDNLINDSNNESQDSFFK